MPSESRAMSYKQLFLLILTIWSAELFTRMLFDMMLPAQMEYRTMYLDKESLPDDADRKRFLGRSLSDVGRRGWKIADVVSNPDNSDQMIVFMQRQTILKIGN